VTRYPLRGVDLPVRLADVGQPNHVMLNMFQHPDHEIPKRVRNDRRGRTTLSLRAQRGNPNVILGDQGMVDG